MSGDGPGKLESLIADISAFERAECLDRWREVFGRPPPKYLSPQFMKRVLIWETQNGPGPRRLLFLPTRMLAVASRMDRAGPIPGPADATRSI